MLRIVLRIVLAMVLGIFLGGALSIFLRVLEITDNARFWSARFFLANMLRLELLFHGLVEFGSLYESLKSTVQDGAFLIILIKYGNGGLFSELDDFLWI